MCAELEYYSFDHGPIHFLQFNTEVDFYQVRSAGHAHKLQPTIASRFATSLKSTVSLAAVRVSAFNTQCHMVWMSSHGPYGLVHQRHPSMSTIIITCFYGLALNDARA